MIIRRSAVGLVVILLGGLYTQSCQWHGPRPSHQLSAADQPWVRSRNWDCTEYLTREVEVKLCASAATGTQDCRCNALVVPRSAPYWMWGNSLRRTSDDGPRVVDNGEWFKLRCRHDGVSCRLFDAERTIGVIAGAGADPRFEESRDVGVRDTRGGFP